jgi:hypothetical protein
VAASLAVAPQEETMQHPVPRGELDRCRAVVGGVVIAVTEARHVPLWPMAMQAMIGPAPRVSVTVVLATLTVCAMRRWDL